MKHLDMVRIFWILLVLTLPAAFGQRLDTEEIDRVREQAVKGEDLGDFDLRVIDVFADQAVEELILTQNLQESNSIRKAIVDRMGIRADSVYNKAYVDAILKYLTPAVETLSEKDLTEQDIRIQRDIMILCAKMGDVRFTPFAVDWLSHTDTTVRYWAVRAISEPVVVDAITGAGADTDLRQSILDGLNTLLEKENEGEVLRLVTLLASRLKGQEAVDILTAIADKRLEAYRAWNVDFDYLEITLLQVMADTMKSQSGSVSSLGWRFGQLYSYVIQRYLKGKENFSEAMVDRLEAVIVTIEQQAVTRALGRSVNTIKAAVEKGGQTLKQEHDALLGAGQSSGQLAADLGYSYPNNSKAPAELPDRPAPQPEQEAQVAESE